MTLNIPRCYTGKAERVKKGTSMMHDVPMTYIIIALAMRFIQKRDLSPISQNTSPADYFIVNSTFHAYVDKLCEVIVAVQTAPPLPLADLFHFGAFLGPPGLKRPPGMMVLTKVVPNTHVLLPMV